MDENLRMMLDASDDVLNDLLVQHAKLQQVMFALCEEIEDDRDGYEIAPMLADANKYAKQCERTIAAVRDYITDIGRELL